MRKRETGGPLLRPGSEIVLGGAYAYEVVFTAVGKLPTEDAIGPTRRNELRLHHGGSFMIPLKHADVMFFINRFIVKGVPEHVIDHGPQVPSGFSPSGFSGGLEYVPEVVEHSMSAGATLGRTEGRVAVRGGGL